MGYFKKLAQEIAEKKDQPDQKKYYIETELGIPYEDCGAWRSYHLMAEGNDIGELWADAHISEVDQDGGDINDYPLEDAGNDVIGAVILLLEQTTGKKICDDCDGEADPQDYESYNGVCADCASHKHDI